MASPAGPAIRDVPDHRHPSFNWVFLGFMILSAFLSLFFLFYFNRAFAYIVSVVLRLYLKWSGNPRYIDIESIQVSPLAGRIFFGRIVYHGPNETIRVVSGHVTWRYWLRRVRHVHPAQAELRAEENGADKTDELPCRMLLDLRGIEWFVYNRSAVYDGVLDRVFRADNTSTDRQSSGYSCNGQYAANVKVASDEYAPSHPKVDDDRQTQKTGSTTLAPGSSSHQPHPSPFKPPNFKDIVERSWYLQMLPIQVECLKGSLVLGNTTTPSLLVGHFERAAGRINAKKSASIDQYQQIFDFTLTRPVINFKPNPEYKSTLLALGQGQQTPDPSLTGTKTKNNGLRKMLHIFSLSKRSSDTSVNRLNPALQSSSNQWMGLSRYLSNGENASPKLSEQNEYAQVDEVISCEQANFLMYWDVVGKVPPQPDIPNHPNINGPLHPSPEWGIRLAFRNSHVNYGPWADRQRVHLQNMFFPRVYRTSTPAERLHAGQDRVYTEMKLSIDFEGDTSLRIPIREPSKDWKYRQPLELGQVRPPGWLDIKMANESTLAYNMAMVPSQEGWIGAMSLDMRKPVVTSSVNNKVFLKAERHTLDCDLSSPLKWCEDTHWVFNNVSTGMELFILREHIILFTDLVSDWTAGPPSEYNTFTPMIYEINLVIKDSEFFFNVNDQNIINNASSLEDNTYIILRHMGGDNGHLSGHVLMDFREFRPRSSVVEFCVETVEHIPGGRSVELAVNTPPWNTWNGTLKETTLGKVRQVSFRGSYDFNAGTSPKLVDTLSLELDGEGLELILHGFLIRYFLIIRANYFGEYMHFKTLEEWGHSKRHHDQAHQEPQPEYTKSNDIDVEFHIAARDCAVLLPEYIDGGGEKVKLGLADLGVDLRFTNYYMDLQVNVSPITACLSGPSPNKPQLFIDGLTLYGHRLFGLPPTEPTYICNWDFDIGAVTGECSLEFIHSLLSAVKGFVFGFKDSENALPEPVVAIIHDVTLLRLIVANVRVWIRSSAAAAVRLEAGEISLMLNDLADLTHSERLVISVPGLNVAVMDPEQTGPNATKAYLETEITATLFGRTKDAMEKRRLQQEHIRASDNRTNRSPFFIDPDLDDGEREADSPSSIPVPGMPPPLRGNMTFKHGKLAPGNKDSRSTLTSSGRSTRSFLVGVSLSTDSKVGSIIHHHPPSSSHAPSFYSAVESLSEVSLAQPQNNRTPTSPYSFYSPSLAPTSAGSKSSRRDVTPPAKRNVFFEMTSMPVEVRPPRSYVKPQFPLDALKPDLSNVPSLESLAVAAPSRSPGPDQRDEEEDEELFTGDNAARTSFVVEFKPGVRAYCTTTALREVTALMDCVAPKTPDDILDMMQHGVIAKLEKLVKGAPKTSKIEECSVKLPQLNLRFQHEQSGRGVAKSQRWKDIVMLQMVNLVAAVRAKAIVDDPILGTTGPAKKAKKVVSAHVMLESIHSTIKDGSSSRSGYQGCPAAAAASFGAEDILFWGSTVQTSTASLNIRTIAASAQSVQAPFLQDATERLMSFIDEFATSLSQASAMNTRRIQQFIPDLAAAGEHLQIHDPASITRPAYVLRTAQTHIRLKDSWKIQARLRHIWHQLSQQTKNQWTAKYCRPEIQSTGTASARDKFVGVLQRWRGWELGDIQSAKIVELLFGKRKPGGTGRPKSARKKEGMGATVLVGEVKIVVDPGPSQHEIAVGGITVSATRGLDEQVKRPGNGVGRDVVVPAEVVVEARVEEARCGIRWEVLDLVEVAMERAAKADKNRPKTAEKSGDMEKAGDVKPKTVNSFFGGVHVLFTLGHGALVLDTVNLTSTSQVHNLAASTVVSRKPGQTLDASTTIIGSLLLRADKITSDLRFGSVLLGGSAVDAPNAYVHFDEHSLAETTFHMWKVGALCEQASFRLEEQILGILEAAEHLIEDEIAQVYQLLQKFSPSTSQNTGRKDRKEAEKREIHMVHGTIAADRYLLGAMILPSLAYELRGEGATMSVKPDSKDPKEIVVEIAVNRHDHDLVSTARKGQRKSISLFTLPIIRTTLRGQNGSKEKLWDLRSRVEEITLEAASVHSFLNALGKPEVVKVAETSAEEIGKMSVRIGEIFGAGETTEKSVTKSTGPPLVYHASLDVAGFRVQAYAPSANLTLSLDFIRARATNKPNNEVLPSGFPDALLEFGKINLELTRATEKDPKELCGYLELHTSLSLSSKKSAEGPTITTLAVQSHSLKIDLYADTASTVVSVVGHLQDRLKELEIPKEVRNQVQRLQSSKSSTTLNIASAPNEEGTRSSALFNTSMSVDLNGIKISWIVGSSPVASLGNQYRQDLVLSVQRIYFETSTKRDSDAQLRIEEFLLQMVDGRVKPTPPRTQNSALLPQVEFNVAYRISGSERRVALQAKGETLDVRLNPSFIVAGNAIQQSIAAASQKFRTASADWKMKPTEGGGERKNMFSTKRLASVIADADFAGAVVNFLGPENDAAGSSPTPGRLAADDGIGNTVLRSPGLAFKVEYIDTAVDDPSLNAEIKVSASNNILYPSVVPLILEMSESVKAIMKQQPESKKQLQQSIQADAAELTSSDTAAILGRCRLNVGFRICQQKFTLSCQPLERVAASAQFEQIYITVNTCDEPDNGRFYASSATVKGLRAELKHIYSRDSAGEFGVENIILSLMNSRHVTGSQGLSCILKVSPIKARVNVNQFRDYLVFREIWTPPRSEPAAPTSGYSYDGLAQRYHEVAATKAFPSNTSINISEIGLTIDFGLKIGRSTLNVIHLWGSSKKSSDWEQSLAIGFDQIRVTSEGRLSGFANLADSSLSSSIAWDPTADPNEPRAPRIKAAIGFKDLQLKVAFESEVFMLAEVGVLDFEMMNRHQEDGSGDRLEAKVTGDKLHFFCTAVTAARSVALNAVLRGMMEEKRKQFRSSLEEIERFMKRRRQIENSVSSSSGAATPTAMAKLASQQTGPSASPIRKDSTPLEDLLSLHTDVMVELSHIFIGVFPSTLGDTRIFRVEATKATARFAREIEHEPPLTILTTSSSSPPPDSRVHSSLEMVFEDFNVEVPSIKQSNPNPALHADVVMEDVVRAAKAARGAPVLRVPRHTAVMNTWDGGREAVEVELEFGNKFQGQVTIGWDLSRIGFIKLLYGIHKSAMEKQLHGNDALPPTFTTSKYAAAADVLLTSPTEHKAGSKTPEGLESDIERKKIKGMPVVKVPQSKYIYVGRNINVETPQLRDMGEATPSLEWLGVNMERLPQVTHQYVIVTLQELARTVEDRYWKILGS